MSKGIRDKVAIIGMGCTKFGEHWDKGAEDLLVESYVEAIDDAGIEKKDIQAVWYGSCNDEYSFGKSAIALSQTLKLPFIPVTRVENMCATGSEAIRGAAYSIAAGVHDVCLAIGVEKLKDTGFGGLGEVAANSGLKGKLILPSYSGPGGFALLATKYFSKYGLSAEKGKEALAMVSAKSHANGCLNPKAHLRKPITVEMVMKAPMIAWPLGLFDCCGVSDGSAAAIVCRADLAKNFRNDPVLIKAMQIAASSGEELMYQGSWDGSYVMTGTQCAKRTYEEAGIKNPREEIDMMEVHDCFSITELVTYEDLQISARGKAPDDVKDGFYNLDGKIPCQPDGGLKCFGHPIGASGLRMMYEMYKQLQGKADKRQIKDPKIGLTHNMGGVPYQNVVSINILGL